MGREVADELEGGGGDTRSGHSPAPGTANPGPHCPTAREAGDLPASRRATRPSATALIPLRGTQSRPHVPAKDGDNGTWPTAPGPRAAGLHSALQPAALSPRPLRRPLVLPASPARPGRARPRMGLSPGGSRARLRSPIQPSSFPRSELGSDRLLQPPFPALPCSGPGPTSFSPVFTFQQRKKSSRLRTGAGPLQLRRRQRWRPRQFQETGRGRHTFHTPASPPFPAPTSAPLPG